jgi:hypothetical protein
MLLRPLNAIFNCLVLFYLTQLGQMRSRSTLLRLVQSQWRHLRVQGEEEARAQGRLRT